VTNKKAIGVPNDLMTKPMRFPLIFMEFRGYGLRGSRLAAGNTTSPGISI
jgi:hypothetical protein